jgi:hypothetical protein
VMRTPSCRLGAHRQDGSRSPPSCGRRTATRQLLLLVDGHIKPEYLIEVDAVAAAE